MTRKQRQSLRAHILENVKQRTIDPQKLLGNYSINKFHNLTQFNKSYLDNKIIFRIQSLFIICNTNDKSCLCEIHAKQNQVRF